MPSMKFLSRLLPLTLLATPLSAQAPAKLPDADPAMWVVKDADTTIYLFGTFHALDGKSDWFNDAVKRAFDGSNELVLETITPDDPAYAPAEGEGGMPRAGGDVQGQQRRRGCFDFFDDPLQVPPLGMDGAVPVIAAGLFKLLFHLPFGIVHGYPPWCSVRTNPITAIAAAGPGIRGVLLDET